MQKKPASADVGDLLEYPEKTAGRIMNPKVFALSEDMTAAEAITALQGSRDVEMVFYLYVIDGRRHLVGVVSLRRLLLVPPDTPLKRIMTTDLISARVDMDQEEVARQVASYNLLAIPVVDEENKLVGVITVDDVIDVIKDEATEDVYRLAGLASDDRVFTTPAESLRKRLPWLIVNLATAFIAASVVKLFEGTIGVVTSLAVFMPVVAGMGGNAATQTLAVIVRGIAHRRADLEQQPQGAHQGSARRHRQRRGVRDRRRRDRVADSGHAVDGRHPGAGDDHQHVRRGDGRHVDPADAPGAQDRSGAGLVGVHHDADRRLRVFLVSGTWRPVHQVLADHGIE